MWLTSVKRVVSAYVNAYLECSRGLAAGYLLWSGNQSRGTSATSEIFSTLLLTNRSRHSPAEEKTSKLWDWQTEVPRDTHCPGWLGKVSLLGTGGEQHPVLPSWGEVKPQLQFLSSTLPRSGHILSSNSSGSLTPQTQHLLHSSQHRQ